jgi:hypothetical protein
MNTGRFLPSLNSKGEVSFRMQGEPNSAPNKLFQAWNAQNPGASQEQQQKAYQDILSGAAGARTSGAASAKLDLPMAPGQESTMAKVGTAGNVELAPMGLSPNQASAQGYRKVETKVLDSARALAPAKQAMADLEQPLVKLAKENQSFMGRASNIAGSRGDFLGMNMGGIAQDLGASHAGDDVKGGWLNFMQHYESVVGGLRGASSPQLQSIMEARGPQPGMNAHQIAQRVTYLKNIVKAMEGEIKNTVSGGRYGGALDKAAISNPNDMKPDAGFLKAVAGK